MQYGTYLLARSINVNPKECRGFGGFVSVFEMITLIRIAQQCNYMSKMGGKIEVSSEGEGKGQPLH